MTAKDVLEILDYVTLRDSIFCEFILSQKKS
jgi:hypothetical protein